MLWKVNWNLVLVCVCYKLHPLRFDYMRYTARIMKGVVPRTVSLRSHPLKLFSLSSPRWKFSCEGLQRALGKLPYRLWINLSCTLGGWKQQKSRR